MQTPVHVLVAGSSGFLGTHLVARLQEDGHRVTRLVRRSPAAGEVRWEPSSGSLPPTALDGVDVVVNLGGSPLIGNPHSRRWADEVLRSRVDTTATVAGAIADRAARGQSVPALIAGNGISYYGDHGDALVTEQTPSVGDALLTRVTRAWEEATSRAEEAGARVCVLRTAVVIDRSTMPYRAMRPVFAAGLGAHLGTGSQYFPIVSRRDWVAAAAFLTVSRDVSGTFNITCPEPPTNAEFGEALAGRRKVRLRVPSALVRRGAGAMAPELLNSVRATPAALQRAGFDFSDLDVHDVLAAATVPSAATRPGTTAS